VALNAGARAVAHRSAHKQHAAALRDAILSKAVVAIADALTESAATNLYDAVSAAADAQARLDAASQQLSSTRDQAAARSTINARDAERSRVAMEQLQTRVAFLTNSLAEKDRLLASGAKIRDTSRYVEDVVEHATRPVQCASEAEACLASLLLYPSLFVDEECQPTRARSRGVNVPEFRVALVRYVRAIDCGSRADALSAYSSLWRSVASSGRLGWRGEIAHAAVTSGSPELFAAALVRPDARRALSADLRLLQRLYRTPVADVAAWLPQGVGVTAPDVQLPERGFCSADHKDSELGGKELLLSQLEDAVDWGSDDLVSAVLESVTMGPSQAYSIADRYYGLRWTLDGTLDGVLSRDDVENMPEYQFVGDELVNIRTRLRENCEFLLARLPSANTYLYGAPGCGKSSSVMALLKEFGPRGLRVIEVTKETLASLPQIFQEISSSPWSFVIFIDDLSFDDNENEVMRMAKAALEGSLRVNPPNVFVLCTSNRRFPVGNRLTDATGEKLAFSQRFGIVLSFPATSRAQYLKIVRALADERGIVMEEQLLDELALVWALGQDGAGNSLSGRTARQFADHVSSVQALKGTSIGPADIFPSTGNRNAMNVPANSDWAER
jgi:uncharacterized protein